MTKKKSTKRALLLSTLSLLMCVSMLIGSTYAWFTDSVTSGSNVIKSGNLDVQMYWADGTKAVPTIDADWTDASTGAIFDYDKWEPGYTEVRHIKIANVGSLALKYQLSINATGTVSELADVIDVYYADPAVQVADRTALTDANKLGTLTQVLANISTTASGNLKAGEKDTITLALKMQESAGNEYQNKSIGSSFEVKLSAIQLNFENDSFGPDYDEGLNPKVTYISTAQDLKDAMLVSGAKIALNDDITIDASTPLQWGSYMFVANGREVTIDLNGHDIIVEDDARLETKAVFTTANGGTLNIVGDGTVEVKNGKSGIFHAMNKNDQINIYGGTYISNSDNGSNSLAIMYTNSGNIDVYGGVFCPLDGVECANAEDKQGNRLSIVFHEGTMLKHTKYFDGYDATRIQLAKDCDFDEVVIDGQTWYVVAKAGTDVVGSAEDFIGATNGGDIAIVDDIVYSNTNPNKQMIMESTDDINFDGNGNTITVTGTDPSVGNHGYVSFVPADGESATVSNLTVTGSGFVGLGGYNQSNNSSFEANNLVVKDIVSPLANGNLGKTVACAFMHYGKTATLNNCQMTGTTAMIDGAIPYDIGFGNNETVVNGGKYGTARVWEHAKLEINGAEIGSMDVALIKGNVTIKAGSQIGTINIDYGTGSYAKYDTEDTLKRLVIEDGATVDAIVYHGTTYTLAEWLAR